VTGENVNRYAHKINDPIHKHFQLEIPFITIKFAAKDLRFINMTRILNPYLVIKRKIGNLKNEEKDHWRMRHIIYISEIKMNETSPFWKPVRVKIF
jgi:hypothetical protein